MTMWGSQEKKLIGLLFLEEIEENKENDFQNMLKKIKMKFFKLKKLKVFIAYLLYSKHLFNDEKRFRDYLDQVGINLIMF